MSATNVQNVSPAIHFMAGGVSGLTSCIVVQPFDLIKTRIQQDPNLSRVLKPGKGVQLPTRSAVITVAREVIKHDGIIGLWRGAWPTVIRNSPGSAAYFAMLNQFKQIIAKAEAKLGVHPSERVAEAASHDESRPQGAQKVVLSNTGNLVAGSSARALVGFLLMPITVIKVRYESNLYNYRSIFSACRSIMAQHGMRGFFSGYLPTLMRDAPYAGLYIAIYEQFKLQLPIALENGLNMHLPVPVTGMAAGMLAGVTATMLTQPFDMVKTRMQLRPEHYGTTLRAFQVVFKEDGLLGFFRGAALRVLRKSVSTSISWTVYEEIIRRSMLSPPESRRA
ncbi:hypothetical protein IWQ60_004822 [Tieghemiomyces parasiticus]|uniref:Mitochondrial glycine transporter n=1 Tax=Tieghemiomyces parasiticus TaxID=78921 RepID=A0A9W8ACY0_9FUNG|nr:hypothetical protein IWQ60_004822 [Tieghemiomyces parasiticus]